MIVGVGSPVAHETHDPSLTLRDKKQLMVLKRGILPHRATLKNTLQGMFVATLISPNRRRICLQDQQMEC